MILGLLTVLIIPLPSLTEGKKVKDFCFLRYEKPEERWKKVSNEVHAPVNIFQFRQRKAISKLNTIVKNKTLKSISHSCYKIPQENIKKRKE